jgi:hypothetical protein
VSVVRAPLVGLACACALASALALAPARACAQVEPAGALGVHMLVADGDLGGLVMLDVWAAVDWLRVGGFVGAGAIPSDRDEHNRVMMPLGISAAAHVVATEHLALSVRLRAGLWGGATQAEKLTVGGFFGGGAYLGFQLGGGALIDVGADVWGVIASDAWRTPVGPDDRVSASTWVIAPGVGLSWSPEVEREVVAYEELDAGEEE